MELNKVIVCTFLFCCNLQLIGSFKVPYQQNHQDNGDYNYQVSFLFSLKKILVQNERTKRKFFQLISSLFQAEERDNNEYKWANKEDNVDTVCCLIFSPTLAMFFLNYLSTTFSSLCYPFQGERANQTSRASRKTGANPYIFLNFQLTLYIYYIF